MTTSLRIEVKAKDSFWYQAFHVEWQERFPDRRLQDEGDGFLIDAGWLEDMHEVAAQVFCRVVVAPQNPQRRAWINALLPSRHR